MKKMRKGGGRREKEGIEVKKRNRIENKEIIRIEL